MEVIERKYTVVSTYPENGSKNIGDALITLATVDAIRRVKGEVDVDVVYREELWDKVKTGILESDAVVFACLAIRKDMDVVYPFLENILNSNAPVGVVAAGTSLNMSLDRLYDNAISGKSLKLLKELNDRVLFWTNRGWLTQGFCDYYDLNKACFSGDIAFSDPRYENISFEKKYEIKNIAISDPHYADRYINSFFYLLERVKGEFAGAQIDVLMHGVNLVIEKACENAGVNVNKIYLNKETGLDAYSEYDMHVGYRVHAHVSSLLRRKVSYLLEQDGRGADYGCSLNARCSCPSWVKENSESCCFDIFINKLKKRLLPRYSGVQQVSESAVDVLLAIIKGDLQNGFEKFSAINDQIPLFNEMCLNALKKLP